MITFTIATCVRNAEQLIGRTIQSVGQQTYNYVQHIIIDGASTDGTLAIVKKYQEETIADESLHDVTVVSEPDHGLYDAMNKALRLASGTYIVFLNAGDTLPSADTLELLAGSVGDGEQLPGVLYGETDIVNEAGEFVRHRRLKAPEVLRSRSFLQGMVVCHQAFYALTEIARQTLYDERYRLSADVDWCIRVMKQSEAEHRVLKNAHMVLVHYLEGGMSIQQHWPSLKERFVIMRRHFGLLPTIERHIWFVFRQLILK